MTFCPTTHQIQQLLNTSSHIFIHLSTQVEFPRRKKSFFFLSSHNHWGLFAHVGPLPHLWEWNFTSTPPLWRLLIERWRPPLCSGFQRDVWGSGGPLLSPPLPLTTPHMMACTHGRTQAHTTPPWDKESRGGGGAQHLSWKPPNTPSASVEQHTKHQREKVTALG